MNKESRKQDWREVFPWVLKEELRKKRIGGASLANVLGIDQRIVYGYLKGTETPTEEQVNEIARIIGCNITTFIDIPPSWFEHIRIQMRADELREISDAKIRRRNGVKPVRIIETGETFENAKGCAEYLGLSKDTVLRHLKAHTKAECYRGSIYYSFEFIPYDDYEYRYARGNYYRFN